MTEHSAGAVLDPLGVTLDLDEDQQVTDVLVIARVAGFGEDSRTALIVSHNPGLDWIGKAGLMAAARRIVDHEPLEHQDEDD